MKTENIQTTGDTPSSSTSCSAFYALFAHMSANHGLALTESELADICDAVDATRFPIVSPDVIARMKSDIVWMQHLLATIRDKADIRYGNNRGVLAFSDLKALAARSLPNDQILP